MNNKKKQYNHALLIEDHAQQMTTLAFEEPIKSTARDQIAIIIQAAAALQEEFS